ncbi:MAG: lipid-transfer protein [Gammaproteobacteria bacterium]|nr:lipid-transfer protein [Gammaproteobacteria bacterium]
MARTFREAAIAGIGHTEFSKKSGRSELTLAAECSKAALDDAGIHPSEVDGMITFTLDGSDEIHLARCLGVKDLAYTTRIPGGGAAAVATVYQAMALVNAGLCETVLIWRAMNERSQYRFGQPHTLESAFQPGNGTGSLLWCMPFGAQTPATWESLAAQRYMQTYGVTNEDFGRVSVVQRKHAATNPHAWFYGKPITLEEHQQSKWIVEPVLRLLDCCQESDGGVALVVTSLERARDLKQKPVKITGACQSIPYNVEVISNYYHADLATMPEAEGTAKRLYRQTGLGPNDIQAAMLYDAFTPQVLKQLEAFGFCKRGEAKDFVRDGHIEVGGRLPVNTNGGLIGEAYIHGMNNIVEAVRQVRGTAVNQVKRAHNVLVSSGMAGAILSHA